MANIIVYNTPKPRFTTMPCGGDARYWLIKDTLSNRTIGQAFEQCDAQFISVKLNQPCGAVPPQWRGLLAMEICDFRMLLERENGGPLIGDPGLAFFFADLCRFLNLNLGETALAMGCEMIVYLDRLEAEGEMDARQGFPITALGNDAGMTDGAELVII